MLIMCKKAGTGLGSPGRDAGDTVCGIPDQRQPVWDGARGYTVFLDYDCFFDDDLAAAVPADDTSPGN